jgi:hypothetical protein
MTMLSAAPGTPVISHLRPSITKSSPSARAAVLQQRRVGAGTVVRLGHREHRPDLPRHQGAQPALLLRLARDLDQQVRVALVGRLDVQGERPQQAVPGGLEDDGHAAVIEAETAPAPWARAATASRRRAPDR